MAMDLQWVVYKLESLWKATNEMKMGQFLILGLIIYMLPSIIHTIYGIISSTVLSILKVIVFLVIAGMAINIWLGSGSEVANMLIHGFKEGSKKAFKSLFM